MRAVAGARQDLGAQRRPVALERRPDRARDRRVDGAREREPLGGRPVGVGRAGGRAQRPLVVGLGQQIVQLAQHAPDLVGGRDLAGRQPAAQVRRVLIDRGAHLFPARQQLPAFRGRPHRLQLGQPQERDVQPVARVDRPVVERARAVRELAVNLAEQQRARHPIGGRQRGRRNGVDTRAQLGQRRELRGRAPRACSRAGDHRSAGRRARSPASDSIRGATPSSWRRARPAPARAAAAAPRPRPASRAAAHRRCDTRRPPRATAAATRALRVCGGGDARRRVSLYQNLPRRRVPGSTY